MKKRILGSTSIEVAPVAFGGAALSGSGGGYGFGAMEKDYAHRLLQFLVDRYITLWDTAPLYGFGESERRMGEFFKGRGAIRERVSVVSKGGVGWHDSRRVNMSNEPKLIRQQFDDSRSRLQSDYIDIYMIHWPDPRVDIRRPLEVLAKFREAGAISHIGLSNTTPDDFLKASELAPIEVLQFELNYFQSNRDPWFVDAATKERYPFGTMAWGTFDKGILTGRVSADRTFDKSDMRSHAPFWKKERAKREEKIKKVEALKVKLEGEGKSLVQVALEHNLTGNHAVDTTLCGAKTVEDWEVILQSLQGLSLEK